MSEVWLVVGAVGAATIAFKAAGPVVLGGRALPGRLAGVVDALAPAVLAALIVTQTLGGDGGEIEVDERVAGLAAAGAAVWARLPFLAAPVAAAVVTGLLRAL